MFRLTKIVKTLLVINAAVFFLEMLFNGSIIETLPFKIWMTKWFALIPLDGWTVRPGITSDFHIWQLITYQFLHGDFWHIFFNMFMLWMFGTELEQFWGSKKFLRFYLICGVGAGILHILISSALGDIAPAIGASGSVYGLLFGFIMLNPDRRLIVFPIFIPLKAKWIGIGMVVLSVVGGISGNDGIAHFAHIGGGLMGFLLVKLLPSKFGLERNNYGYTPPNSGNVVGNIFNKKEKQNPYSITWETPSQTNNTNYSEPNSYNLKEIYVDGQRISQEMLDTIIDKISQSGYASLTEQEKYILTEVSKQI
ncbi:MAG: rhomboid family intramembrane serine protease [Bacteroidetes bacterium]|nr:rhomboid family intramembrane serine protease [Bacteroidota bacterium]